MLQVIGTVVIVLWAVIYIVGIFIEIIRYERDKKNK